MGNMLPCLVQGGSSSSSILPPMNIKHWSRSMKLLARTLRRSTKLHRGSNRVKAAAGSTVASSAEAADQATPRTRRAPRSGERQSRRAAIRVKVVLTRAEAARLLSLTAHGHRTAAEVVGELKRMQAATGTSRASTAQVISELKRMEELVVARANTSPLASMAWRWRPVLESIPEEWH